MKRFLHVGCGPKRKSETTPGFDRPEWQEVRLDIDPAAAPDIVASMTDMAGVGDGSFDAVFSSHNIEHLYAHEVPRALAEFRRVLRPEEGFAVITCPDLRAIARLVAEDRLAEPVGMSNAGPIAPIDMLFGWRPALAAGNHFMAHRCGFTFRWLAQLLREAGFGSVLGGHPQGPYNLWVLATCRQRAEPALRDLARAYFVPPPGGGGRGHPVT